MARARMVHRTVFNLTPTKDKGEQWFWTTFSPNFKDTIADGGEGYDNLDGALNGYFANQGFPDWKPEKSQYGSYVMPTEEFISVPLNPKKFVVARFDKKLDGKPRKIGK